MIIAGSFSTSRSLKGIYALAEHLHFPILPDILSGVRFDHDHPMIIPYYDALVKSLPNLKPDCILHLGDRLVSKTLLEWIKNQMPQIYALVADHPFRHDPNHVLTHRVECDPTLFCEQVLPFTSHKVSWYGGWKEASNMIEGELRSFESTFTEFGLIRFLHHHIPQHYAIFFSNSLPIRHADQFFFPKFFKGPIFCNRGLSGIDGNIGTAIGIATGSQRPTIAILGDSAALHDLNSLAQLHKTSHPVIFLIINNHGGGIFSFASNPANKKNFEKFWADAHTLDFEHAAKTFHIPYLHLTDFSSLAKALKEEKSCIIEMTTNREETHTLHTKILEKIQLCLNSSYSTVS
ncbi:MAG: thiamine pyrophosphate-dependent enzyme [Rhabdochlamydiaceae bacterium]